MRRYGRAWKRIRDKYIKANPNCEKCGAIAEEVHHIIPISQGGKLLPNNLMALCKECHRKEHDGR